jgi:hypothetical protein
MPPDLPEVCRRALQSQDPAALLELRARAKAVLEFLGHPDIQAVLTVEPNDPAARERIAAVYDALAAAEPCRELAVDTREVLLRANQEEEKEIGRAFKEALLDRLERVLANPVLVFAAVPRVSAREQRHLRQTASAAAGWPECAGLVACGLTPLGLFYATKNAFPLAKRLQERKLLPSAGPVVLAYARAAAGQSPKSPAELTPYVVREVLRVARCSEQAAGTLVDWLIDIARRKPLVFGGAWAERDERGVRLTAHEDYSNPSLDDRWRLLLEDLESASGRPPAAAAAAAAPAAPKAQGWLRI